MDASTILSVTWSGNHGNCLRITIASSRAHGKEIYKYIERVVVHLTFKIPKFRKDIDAQIVKALATVEEKYGNLPPGVMSYRKMPKIGMSEAQIVSELEL